MELYSCKVRHAGNRGMEIPVDEVTPADIVLLRHVHGPDSVHSVRHIRQSNRQQAKERERLARKFSPRVFQEAYPGIAPRLPLTLADAGLRDDGTPMGGEVEENDGDDAPVEMSAEAQALAARVEAKRAAAAGKSLT